ncbi:MULTISPECIES: hypothetical protein [unclassified Arthrobacter]|uniref:hypothetical protein n=1 Tax=Arthrobacter sp. N1 TaxID=619291 RepID=UPI003BB1E94A
MREGDATKAVSVAAAVLFAGFLGAWFWITIQQGVALKVAGDTQAFRLAVAVLLFAPFLVLIYLCLEPEVALKTRSSQGSLLFAALRFAWLLCARFYSLLLGFAPF